MSSGHTSNATFSPFPSPVPDCTVTSCHFDTNRSCYLLTYYDCDLKTALTLVHMVLSSCQKASKSWLCQWPTVYWDSSTHHIQACSVWLTAELMLRSLHQNQAPTTAERCRKLSSKTEPEVIHTSRPLYCIMFNKHRFAPVYMTGSSYRATKDVIFGCSSIISQLFHQGLSTYNGAQVRITGVCVCVCWISVTDGGSRLEAAVYCITTSQGTGLSCIYRHELSDMDNSIHSITRL